MMQLVERIEWLPVHGATLRVQDDGSLVLGDGATLDYHLLRWTDRRLNGVRIKLTITAKPVDRCDTNLYVHHWGHKDICSIEKDGRIAFNEGAEELSVERRPNGFLALKIIFLNHHPTLSIGLGKPRGHYQGAGTDQYLFQIIEVELLPLNAPRQIIIDRLWRGNDPFRGFPANLFEHDLQGWNSQHAYLSDAIAALRPSVIVEVGVWKGGSTVFMANEAKALGLPSVVIAVDTWLGSSEHWVIDVNFAEMSLLNGYPALYYKFISNVIRAGVADHVLPMPTDSLSAAEILKSLGISAEMIHLDSGHGYESVIADLRAWWPLLVAGGILIGDDYTPRGGGGWVSVQRAFDDFFGALDLIPIENIGEKCRVRKPG
jgi:predicted O-methyltransferase YrrM